MEGTKPRNLVNAWPTANWHEIDLWWEKSRKSTDFKTKQGYYKTNTVQFTICVFSVVQSVSFRHNHVLIRCFRQITAEITWSTESYHRSTFDLGCHLHLQSPAAWDLFFGNSLCHKCTCLLRIHIVAVLVKAKIQYSYLQGRYANDIWICF